MPVVFLDDGGVMNDNAVRAPQWRHLVGEFMPQHLGGTPEQWAEANRVTFPVVWDDLSSRMRDFACHEDFQREYDHRWLDSMCAFVGVPTPSEPQVRAIAREAADFLTANVRADHPDAIPAIRALHSAGFELHTASGTRSWELENILGAMGVRECVGYLFGPDLVGIMKGSPEYYRRVFARAGVDPRSAVVIDDSERSCAWAEAAGATAIRIDRTRQASGAGVMPDLATAGRWLLESFGGRTG